MHQLTDREVLEYVSKSKMSERLLRVPLELANGPTGICELYVHANPDPFYAGDRDKVPMDESELRQILKSLVQSDWVMRKGHEYTLSDSTCGLIAALKPRLEKEAEALALQEARDQARRDAERDERLRERAAKRKEGKTALWKLLWDRQGGKCCLCEEDMQPLPNFKRGPDGGYEESAPPFILKLREVGSVLPCERCYGRLIHVKGQEQFLGTKEYWKTVDAARAANPDLISRGELIKSGIRPKELQVLTAQGVLHAPLVAGRPVL